MPIGVIHKEVIGIQARVFELELSDELQTVEDERDREMIRRMIPEMYVAESSSHLYFWRDEIRRQIEKTRNKQRNEG